MNSAVTAMDDLNNKYGMGDFIPPATVPIWDLQGFLP
jgi:hypothetical protein